MLISIFVWYTKQICKKKTKPKKKNPDELSNENKMQR